MFRVFGAVVPLLLKALGIREDHSSVYYYHSDMAISVYVKLFVLQAGKYQPLPMTLRQPYTLSVPVQTQHS
jgi:hypothetical protein